MAGPAAPETKLATPIKRSALNVELDVGDTDSEDSELLSSPPTKRQKTIDESSVEP
ncbi:BQ5605_C006g04263 [Microbotryum silenes-dioicae]|uniref:BQ5605_C006g04263 protein n=1 Tax=Microbotryum silenes-dioicae TaxID=796604 RepID=A0A2X0MAK7_9BASI|nr:BQ5605_C006g04263 [Microbotryum silenes-dioicae]